MQQTMFFAILLSIPLTVVGCLSTVLTRRERRWWRSLQTDLQIAKLTGTIMCNAAAPKNHLTHKIDQDLRAHIEWLRSSPGFKQRAASLFHP